MLRQQNKTRNMKNQENMTPPADPKGMAALDLSNKKFKITVLGKLNEIQENKDNSTKSVKQSMNKISLTKDGNH